MASAARLDDRRDLGAFGRVERLQHERRWILPARWAADTDADPLKVLLPKADAVERRPPWPPSPPPILSRMRPKSMSSRRG